MSSLDYKIGDRFSDNEDEDTTFEIIEIDDDDEDLPYRIKVLTGEMDDDWPDIGDWEYFIKIEMVGPQPERWIEWEDN